MDLPTLRTRWSDVLDVLEKDNRMAWIIYFDARLARIEGNCLTLDFSDSEKFANGIGFGERRIYFRKALEEAIEKVCGEKLEIQNI